MTLAKWCKAQGMTAVEYKAYQAGLQAKALEILENKIKTRHKPGTGIYYPIEEIGLDDTDIEHRFLMQVLKKELGVDFYDDHTDGMLYRY